MSSFRKTTSALCLLLTVIPSSLAATNDSSYQPQPYTIDVDPAFIDQIRFKAGNFSSVMGIDVPAWFDGPPVDNVTDLASYLANDFDWFAYQDQLNTNFTHYNTTVPAPGGSYNNPVELTFIHQVSSREDAIPILMLHGWPSTSLEWGPIIPSLVNPPNSSLPAFNVVAPDIPGFGFSPAPTAPLGRDELANVFAELMAQLGYDRYALYSTDLGFAIAQSMIPTYSSRIINHVSDFYVVFPNATDTQRIASGQATAEEVAYASSINAFLTNHSAYAQLHSTLPLSLAYALYDSPVGFLAWMWQLVYTGADGLQTPFDLVTRALLLYIPGVYGNIRSYKELYGPDSFTAPLTSVPTSVLQYGGFGGGYKELMDFNYVPLDWIQRTANVTYYSRHPEGGHFPAESVPQLVIDDMWNIFGSNSSSTVPSRGRARRT